MASALSCEFPAENLAVVPLTRVICHGCGVAEHSLTAIELLQEAFSARGAVGEQNRDLKLSCCVETCRRMLRACTAARS